MNKMDILFKNFCNNISFFGGLLYYIRRFNIKNDLIMKKNRQLMFSKNKCYILGLGPSLKVSSIENIENADIMVVNRFFVFSTEENFDIEPDYYVLIDGYFYNDGIEFTKKIINKYKNTIFFLNIKYRKKINIKRDNIYYISTTNTIISKKSKIKINKSLHFSNNVIHACIELCMGMHYQEIHLLGCDFNSFANHCDMHCYHKNNEFSTNSLFYKELYAYALADYIHNKLYLNAQKKGIKIINNTPNSLLTVYPMQKIDH